MADPGGNARACRLSGPQLPKSVTGLIRAMRAFGAGDPRPLDAWDQERFPILKHVLDVWARDTDLGDRLALRIVREAFFALRAGREVRSELSWMAGVALRGRAEILSRERSLDGQITDDIEGSAEEPIDEMMRREDRERVRRAIATLPNDYRVALTLRYLLDCTEVQAAAHLQDSLGIGLEAARRLLRGGRAMVKFVLEGGDPPRTVCGDPRREGKKTGKIRTPPPPFPEHRG